MDIRYDNTQVRRQDRLLHEERAMELLHEGEYGFLALGGPEGGYGIPLNYAAEGNSIYFHCAPEGEKLERIRRCGLASFCIVGRTAPQPALFTTEYESVMVTGKVSVVHDDTERMHALMLLLGKYSPDHIETGLQYTFKSFSRTTILRLDVDTASGKSKSLSIRL